jgi:endogenous inhibitor of DNA gyrase (YacG/DUF329 family)
MAQSKPAGETKTVPCPICGKPSEHAYRPFCSRRCADVDLARWLRGAYAIPDAAASEDGGPPSEPDAEGDGRGSPH